MKWLEWAIVKEVAFKTYASYKDILVLTAYSFIENMVYRQIHSWWRLQGLFDFLKGNKSWGKMTRKGFKKEFE